MSIQAPIVGFKKNIQYFIQYFKNPLNAIKSVPNWDLKTTFLVQVLFCICVGFISDRFSSSAFFKDIWFFPISSIVTSLLGTGFFYFLFLVLLNKELPFTKLYAIVFLSHIPFLILRLFKFWVAPIELIGFLATSALLTVGFVENLQLPRRKILKIIGALFSIYFLSWSAQQLFSGKRSIEAQKNIHKDIDMDSLEIIKNDLDF